MSSPGLFLPQMYSHRHLPSTFTCNFVRRGAAFVCRQTENPCRRICVTQQSRINSDRKPRSCL